MKKKITVGIFDSGIGGLTVLKECAEHLSGVTFLYYGDNLHAPYGSKNAEEILYLTREAVKRFARRGTDAVVLACNTATAVAVDELRREFSFPIIGTEPAVKPAAEHGGNVLVLATPRTVQSVRLRMLTGRFPDCHIRVYPAAHLAEAVERHFIYGEPLYLKAHLPEGRYDAVVLGCTHFVYLKKEISQYYSAPVFDGGEGTAKRLANVLKLPFSGTADHQLGEKNPNNCFTLKRRNFPQNRVKFIGKCRKINKLIYFRTFVSEKTKK